MANPSRLEDLRPGDHAGLTFADGEERLDLVAAFIRDGLRMGQKVLCLTDSISRTTLQAHLADRGVDVDGEISEGRLDVRTSAETFLADGSFVADRMLQSVAGYIEQARAEGHSGFRLAGDMCWALRPVAGVDELLTYESRLSALCSASGCLTICQYDRRSFDPVTLAGVAASHKLTLAAVTYHDDALLRICRQYVPAGLRVAGEIDYRAVGALTTALTESLSLDEHVHVNLTQLSFIDAEAAGALLRAAMSLSRRQRMTVRCQPLVCRVLRALGAAEIPNLTVVVTDAG